MVELKFNKPPGQDYILEYKLEAYLNDTVMYEQDVDPGDRSFLISTLNESVVYSLRLLDCPFQCNPLSTLIDVMALPSKFHLRCNDSIPIPSQTYQRQLVGKMLICFNKSI